MNKFSFADEFNRVADVARIGDADDVRISYSVFVGSPEDEDEDNFLDGEFFSADDFTTWSDAAKAKQLVATVLKQIDEHLAMRPAVSNYDLRRAVLQVIQKALDDAADATRNESDHGLIAGVYYAEVLCAVNAVFAAQGK